MGSPSFLHATKRGGWADDNDDRWGADPVRGLFYVGDASGPTYGGYYAPFGVDPGLATFEAVFRCEEGDGPQRLRKALLAAHEHMHALSVLHDQIFKTLHSAELDGLRASLKAADAVRPASWEHLRGSSFAHFGASLTACCIEHDRLGVIQVGSGRAYLFRDGESRLLAPDHTLPTVLGTDADTARFHCTVVVSLLGIIKELSIHEASCELRADDRILLCSDGIWAQDDGARAVQALLSASTQQELDDIVTAAAAQRCDATAVLIRI